MTIYVSEYYAPPGTGPTIAPRDHLADFPVIGYMPPGLEFDPIAHEYKIAGRKVPGVTSVIDAILGGEFAFVDAEKLEIARQRGTAVHKLTELDDAGTLDDASIDPALIGYLAAWQKFRADCIQEMIAIETRVACPAGTYAGTLDRVALLKSHQRPHVIDIKTGSIPKSVGVQLAAYRRACPRELRPSCGLDTAAVLLMPNGDYKFRECAIGGNDEQIFISALNCYQWRKTKYGN